MPGPIQDTVNCSISAGDFEISRSLYLTGQNTITPRTAADGQEFELNAISISGSADFVPPTVTMLSPTSGANLTNEFVTARVRATDNVGVSDVQFSLNGGDFSSGEPDPMATDVWTMDFILELGPNTLQVLSYDDEGNVSATNTIRVSYVVLAPLSVQTIGSGTMTPNYSNQMLIIGNSYTMTARPAAGFAFVNWVVSTNWVGGITNTSATLNFVMQTNLTLQASFVDTNKPVLAIAAPTKNQRWSNAVFTVRGTAKDNVQVTEVWCQTNGVWGPASVGSAGTNWTMDVALMPGTNTVRAYAMDGTGNKSTTNSVSFVYVLNDRLLVRTVGQGTLTPNYSNAVLEIGKSYSMKASGVNGHGFTNWVVSTNWVGGVTSNNGTLSFIMQSNLTLQASFVDTNRPVLVITAPTANQRWSNAVFTVRGTAKDNARVSRVRCEINGVWGLANASLGGTNWTIEVALVPGTNTVRACAEDAAGNWSATNSVSFVYVVTNRLLVAATGKGTISPDYSNAWMEVGKSYSMKATGINGHTFTNWAISTNWIGGVTTNNATVQFMMRSNLTLRANFADVTRPTNVIILPKSGQKVNAVMTAIGTASDNAQVAEVKYQLNSNAWAVATGTTSWSAAVCLLKGTNVLRAYALDPTGNRSATNSVTFVCTNDFRMSLSFSYAHPLPGDGLGLSLDLTPGLNCRIEGSTDLVFWTTLTNFVGTNVPVHFRDSAAPNYNRRFYRAVSP